MPYKLLITYRNDESNPWIDYYYVAYSGDKNLVAVSLGDSSKDYEIVYDEILQSYHLLNRVPKIFLCTVVPFKSFYSQETLVDH